MKIQGAAAYSPGKIPYPTKLSKDGHNVLVQFPQAIAPNTAYQYELSLLLDPAFIQHIGSLKFIEWPKEDLTEIILLPRAGKLFFSWALGKITIDPQTKNRIIKPLSSVHQFQSHERKASAIRIEWGQVPTIRMAFRYTFRNLSGTPITNCELKTYLPPITKFQQTEIISTENFIVEEDQDENRLVRIPVPLINPSPQVVKVVTVDIRPQGNLTMVVPNFGTAQEYMSLTQPHTIGSVMLAPSKYWNLDDANISALVRELKRNSKNMTQYIQLAFEFVNQKIHYELNGVRYTAAYALQARKGDCSELTDLFVTLMRAGGIPAKVIHGWVVEPRDRSLGPHAWCEYMTPHFGWMQCDPTWGFLTGVSGQHICRHREGLIPDQHDYEYKYMGQAKIDVTEEVKVIKIT